MTELIIRLKALYSDTDPIALAVASAMAVIAFFIVYFFFFLKDEKPPDDEASLEKDQVKSCPDAAVAPKPSEVEHIEPPPSPKKSEVSEVVSFESAVTERKEFTVPFSETIETEPASSSVQEQEPQHIIKPETPHPQGTEKDFFSRLSLGLGKTRRSILKNLEAVFSSGRIDDDMWDEFEEILVMSDIGVSTTAKLRENVSSSISFDGSGDMEEIKTVLEKEILGILKRVESPVTEFSASPVVFMIVGVNGVGKTTSIGKIANRFTQQEKKVMVAAADTFRAAAVEQLGVWAERVGSEFLRGQMGADPSSVAYDAVSASVSRGLDLLIIDTAGRVQTNTGLMEELKKVKRVMARVLQGAPHEVLLVVDATTGQNAVEQARVFSEAIGVTGIVLTKLDGTAKGGIVVAIADRLGIPVKYIGVGESLWDLREFDAEQFAKALFSSEEKTLH